MGFQNWAKAQGVLEIYCFHALKGVAIDTFLKGLAKIEFSFAPL